MFNFLFGKPVGYTTQIFFSLLGLFLAMETYFVFSGMAAFASDGGLRLIARLKIAVLALFLWLPLVGAIVLFQIPMIFRRIAAFFLLPVIVILVFIAQEDLSRVVGYFNRNEFSGARANLLSSIIFLTPCIAIIYLGLLLFFAPHKKFLK